MAAREPAKSCEGARSESRRPKRYKNRGFERSRKLSKKVSFCISGRPVSRKKRRKSRFWIRFGLPRNSSFCTFFRVFVVRPRSENRENASFLRVSRPGPVLGCFVFCRKTGCPKKCEKCLRPKKRCTIIVLEPSFGPFLAHRFRGWVFLRCGARFWAPITREKCHFSTSWTGPKRPPPHFFGAFSLRSRVGWRGKRRSPCGAASFGWVRTRRVAKFDIVGPKTPWKLRKEAFLGSLTATTLTMTMCETSKGPRKIAFSLRSRAWRPTFGRSPCGLARSHSSHPFWGTCSNWGLDFLRVWGSTWLLLAVFSFLAALCCGV